MSGFGVTCSRCGKSLPAGAGFCDGCGARIEAFGAATATASPAMAARGAPTARPGFVAVGRGISICHGCGAFAPPTEPSCKICGAALGTSLEALPRRGDGLLFAQVRTSTQCSACGVRGPLDPLELGEPARCPRCHAVRMLFDEAWPQMVEYAHGITDLAGARSQENAQLPRNPAAALGVTHTRATWENSGLEIAGGVQKTRNLEIVVAPGAPLCESCGSPIEPTRDADGIATRCVGCGATARYRMPQEARRTLPGSVVGAIAEDLRTDRPTANLDATSAGMVIAVKCPSCGANLDIEEGAHAAVCRFCQTHCRIPSRTLLALKKEGPDAAPRWWLVFEGPSRARERLARGRAPFPFIDDDDGEEFAPASPAPPPPSLPMAKIEEMPVKASREHEILTWTLQIAVPLGVLAFVLLAVYGRTLLGWASLLGLPVPAF